MEHFENNDLTITAYAISLPEFLSNTNREWLVIVAVLKLLQRSVDEKIVQCSVFRVKTTFLNSSARSLTNIDRFN